MNNVVEEVILYKKDDFIFRRVNENHYEMKYNIENNNILLNKLVDFGLMKLIYDLNPDIYLQSNIEKINENEVYVTLLLKHLFEDLGLPQRYSYVHMHKIVEDNKIKFVHYQLGAKLEKTAKSIMQPISDVNVQPIIIIVPALAYSLQGYRLGFGSGHYDRYFAEHTDFNNKKPIIKIGVCFDKYLLEFLPTESHDIKFDYIVTDEIILKL